MSQASAASSQRDISDEIALQHAAASADASQPQIHFPPYRSSLLRSPTRQIGLYCGVPAANHAFAVAREVLAPLDAEAAPQA